MRTIRFFGVLVALLLVTVPFMPGVAAQSMEKSYARWTLPDTNITLLSDDGRTAVYTMIFRYSESDTRYFQIEKRRAVTADGTETGTILVQTSDSCGCDIRGSFGKQSTYTKTPERLWIHLTPQDMEEVYNGEDGHLKFSGLFSVATGLSSGESVIFMDHILPTTRLGHFLWTNADDSLDFFISTESVALISKSIKNPYCLWIPVGFGGNIQTSYCL